MEAFFDPLKFYDELKTADVPEKQARAQAEAMRNAFAAYDASRMQDLATKGDIQEVRLEIEKVRSELREVELRLQKEIESVRTEIKAAEIRLLKWQIGGWVALAAIMAKGFGWLGF